MCKKSEFKRVLKGGEIKCQQNQTTSVVEVVQELVADRMTVDNTRDELSKILNDKTYRQQMLDGYQEVADILGTPGAPHKAAKTIFKSLV